MENDNNLEALTAIVNALKSLDKDAQRRTIQAVITYLDIFIPNRNDISIGYSSLQEKNEEAKSSTKGISFSEDRTISAKNFMRDKSPKTDTERVACLAYYLTHYQNLPHFKTIDLSTLNTGAAQPKFSNAAVAVQNAAIAGLLVPAGKGNKQLSSVGEEFVRVLPDRELGKEILANMRSKKRVKKHTTKSTENKNKK